jgi:hypothetical protein
MCPPLICFSLWIPVSTFPCSVVNCVPHHLPGCDEALPHGPTNQRWVVRGNVMKDNSKHTSWTFFFSDSSLHLAIFASGSFEVERSVDIHFVAVIPHTARRIVRNNNFEHDTDENRMSQELTACLGAQTILDVRKQVSRSTSWAIGIRDEVRLFVCEPSVLQHLCRSRALCRVSR